MIGALLGIGPLVGAVAAPFAGSLSDRVERKTVLTLTLLSMALSLVGMGLAESVLAFCIAQIVAAIALAIYEPISRALMSDVCPQPLRLKYFSWRYTATNAGWAIGPLIGIAAGAASTTLFIIAGAVYVAFAVALHLLHVPIHQGDVVPQANAPVPLLESLSAANPRSAADLLCRRRHPANGGLWPMVSDACPVPHQPCRRRHGNLRLSRFNQWCRCPDRKSVRPPVHRTRRRSQRARDRLHFVLPG